MKYSIIHMTEPSSTRPWRPWALRLWCLIGFIFFCLLLLTAIVVVILGCATNGCHVFGKSEDGSLPRISEFLYRQFPTILCVFLGLFWVLPHHDIIRLEPYFRMSMEGGETAADSLFLEYPYDFLALLPIKGLLNKHYAVALSSSILILMNFLVLSTLPSIFDSTLTTTSSEENAVQTSYIPSHNVTANSTFLAYDRAWYNGSLSPFMTDQYALLPLHPDGYDIATNESWVVETTLLEAEMQCVDARTPIIGYVNNTLTINITSTDGRGVYICDAGAYGQRRITARSGCELYTAFTTPWTSISWQIRKGVEPVSYMYAWASGPPSPPEIINSTFPPPVNITAIFCTPSYYSEPVKATISMPSGEVLNVTRSGKQTQISSPPAFDDMLDGSVKQNFSGEVLLTGVSSTYQFPVRFGYPLEILANVSSNLLERFGQTSKPIEASNLGRKSTSNVFMTRTNSLQGFSLYNHTNETLSTLLDRRVLKKTHEEALKMVFAFAIAEMVRIYPDSTSLVTVERQITTAGIGVNLRWALVVIIGLAVVISLTIFLVVYIYRRPFNLKEEPDSLAACLRLLSGSPDLCRVLKWSEYYEPKDLLKAMERVHFKLSLERGHPKINVVEEAGIPDAILLREPDGKLVQESELWGLIKTASLASVPVVLVVLIISFLRSRESDGFPMPGGPNTTGSKILFQYLPMVIISCIEPMLVTFSSLFCLVRPYKALEKNNASTYSKSLSIDYDRLPPQFQMSNSLKKSDYTLFALSLAILLSNVLPITVSGLFPSALDVPKIPRSHNILNSFTNIKQEAYFQLEKNLTSDYYATWILQDLYINPPFEIAPSGEDKYNTRGFGMDIACTHVADDRISFPCRQQYSNRTSLECAFDNSFMIDDICGRSSTAYASWVGDCIDGIIVRDNCPGLMFPFWAENRTDAGVDSYQHVILNCSFTDRIMNLDASVKDGQILSVTNVRQLDAGQVALLYPAGMTSLSQNFVNLLHTTIDQERTIFGNHAIPRINTLIATADERVLREPRNRTHIPDGAIVVGTFEKVLRGLFVNMVRASAGEVFGAGVGHSTGSEEKYRVHVDMANFSVAMVILLYSCGILLFVYFWQDKKLKGHLPSTLAGSYSRLYASNVTEDMKAESTSRLKEIKRRYRGSGATYRYKEYGNHYTVYKETEEEPREVDPKEAGVVVAPASG